jgi:IS66 Orf2 like protein
MFFAEAQIRVHLYGQPTDMRKSYDGLQALARHAMGRDPLDGALYAAARRSSACILIAADFAFGASGSRAGDSSAIGATCVPARWTGRP